MPLELANNPQGDGVVAPEADEELANPATEQENEEVEEEATDEDGQPKPDDTEEIEHEGQKYKLPKALKGALLMQQDYTRKTQEVAAERKALEERNARFAQDTESYAALQKDYARATALADQIEQFEKVNWDALQTQDRETYDTLWRQYQQVSFAHKKAHEELQAKVTKRVQENAAATAKRYEETRAILQRDIGWTPELHGKMADFAARELGFTPAEINAVTDPRLHKLLHRAFIGDQAIKKAAAAQKLKTQEGVQPPTKVGTRASSSTIRADSPASDKLSADEWSRRREEELRKKRA